MPLLSIGAYGIERAFANRGRKAQDAEAISLNGGTGDGSFPDIYYIILDGYPSDANLKEFYDFDNQEFTACLRDRGFYIASESRSNYALTFLSLASSLNLDYLQGVVDQIGVESIDRSVPAQMISDSTVKQFLRSKPMKFDPLPVSIILDLQINIDLA